VRINKFFTQNGLCSRRQADRYIQEKRVQINGRMATLGDQVSEADQVTLDGKQVHLKPEPVYIMYYKPQGIISTTDPQIPGNIVHAVKHPQRIFPIGRLDKDSTGLILLTNDGDIVNHILRAQFGHEKEYVVEINRPLDAAFLDKMSRGVDIGDHVTRPCKIKAVGKNTFSIILTEGKNRQIRRMCLALGATVKHLHRIRIMNIVIGDLKSGQWQDVPARQLGDLKKLLQKAVTPMEMDDDEE